MAFGAGIHRRSTRVLLQQIRRQRRGPIRRPRRFVWWMLDHFRRRLRGVVTLDARDRFRSVNAAILRSVIEVAKLDAAQLGVRSKNHFVLWLSSFLGRRLRQTTRSTQQKQTANEY